MINKFVISLSKSSSIPYSYVSSQPIGKGSYKETYLYLYKSNKWKPHIRITLVGCHIHPGNAYEEIKALVNNVYADIKSRLEKKDSFLFNLLYCFGNSCINLNILNEPIILMGDFNASGSYLNKNKQKTLDNILYNNNLMWELIILVIPQLPPNAMLMIDLYLKLKIRKDGLEIPEYLNSTKY
ncbi:12723_t:CDS:2 [Racocetra persica]|uniref:12723_t:CDS:1 n=1 Tax=Racocetra persica TaxID=160502 RepID=A0ACA9KZY1_9GLOM|nr:12723_t:CDS:2 [Racocetra persica]